MKNKKPLEASQPIFNTKHLAEAVKKSFLKLYMEYKAEQRNVRAQRELMLAT